MRDSTTAVRLHTCPACGSDLPVYRVVIDSGLNPHTEWQRVVLCGCGEELQVLRG